MGRKLLPLCLSLALLSGCVTTNATMLGTAGVHPPSAPSAVAIYLTADRVPGKYEEIALLHAQGPADMTNEPQMYESMKEKAASLGANAIILDAISEPSAGAKIAGYLFGVSAERKGKAVAVYVFPPGEEPPTATPQPATIKTQAP